MTDAADILREFGIGPPPPGKDRYYTICPQCSANRSRAHQKNQVLRVTIDAKGVRFYCNHCEWNGGKYFKVNGKDRNYRADVREFPYCDESGNVVLVVERRGDKDNKKIKQKRPDPDHAGKWIWNVSGVRVVPYRLPELIEAIAVGNPIFIPEGENKVDLLQKWNIAATCNAGGAGKWKPEHSAFLQGADVILIPDHDNPGWNHINQVGGSLIGIVKRVRVLMLPGLKEKGDIIDWAKAGGTREQLDALVDQAQDWKAPTEQEQEEEKAKEKAREDERLDTLAKLDADGLDYIREKQKAAEDLKVRPSDIENLVKARREVVPLYGHWIVEPWPEPVDGDCLLRDINNRYRRQIISSHDASLTISLWTMFSWVHNDIAIYSPILLITSAESECGKSTTLGLLAHLAPHAIASVDISKAALYRSIQVWQPSFIIDEFDTVLASKDGDKNELKAVINSGHTRGQVVFRCITDEHKPEPFPTFAAKAIGMIGRKMPAPTLSRCIIVELQRRTKDEAIDKFKHKDDPELANLRSRLMRWSMDNADTIEAATVLMPPTFDNRLADNWRDLFAIADLCSGVEDWGDKARLAATNLEGESDVISIGIRLLVDCKRIRDEVGGDCILSAELVARLKEDPEGPWAEWNRGKGLTQKSLAALLGGGGGRGRRRRGGFGIHSQTVHPPGQKGRGYVWTHFEDAWKRYLPVDDVSSASEGQIG